MCFLSSLSRCFWFVDYYCIWIAHLSILLSASYFIVIIILVDQFLPYMHTYCVVPREYRQHTTNVVIMNSFIQSAYYMLPKTMHLLRRIFFYPVDPLKLMFIPTHTQIAIAYMEPVSISVAKSKQTKKQKCSTENAEAKTKRSKCCLKSITLTIQSKQLSCAFG